MIDLEDYVCAYPEITTWGGAGGSVRIHWQESLFEVFGKDDKGNRDAIEGKYFATIHSHVDGIGDTFYPNGDDRLFMTPLWWD
ncbi:alpha-L-rhamnosidase, partial [Pseudomonas sp. MPR-R1B]